MSDLNTAIKIAIDAHAGQVDKAGEPYILHPLRVMLAMQTEIGRIVGVLHDVVEDSDLVGLGDILAFFGPEVRDAVDAVTRRHGENYAAFIERASRNPLGREVKIADLRDNVRGTHGNRERYQKALAMLGAA
jgi:(p)ppGpp synthase/HD superfamily hydrolase